MHSKEFENKILDEDIALVNAEIARLEGLESELGQEIDALLVVNAGHMELVGKLQDLLAKFGDFLPAALKEQMEAQILSSQSTIAANELIVDDDRKQLADAELDLPEFKDFAKRLESLKKKDENAFLVLIGNIEGEEIMEINLDKNGKAQINKIVDRAGNPAKIDGVPQWKSEGDDIAELTPSEDGMSCEVKAKGPLGSAQLSCSVDRDPSEAVELLESNKLEIKAVAGPAAEVLIEEA